MKKLYLSLNNSPLAKRLRYLAATVAVICFAAMLPVKLFGQAPTLSYSSPQTYTAHVAITPLTPTSSGVAAPTGAYGSPVVLGSGLTRNMSGIAVDAGGNMYVMDHGGSGVLKKIAADGSSTTVIASGFLQQGSGVAVDKSGNLYVADQQNIWKVPASGSPVVYGTPVKIDEGSFGG